eukprot:3587982-Amphidinium_carterae.1
MDTDPECRRPTSGHFCSNPDGLTASTVEFPLTLSLLHHPRDRNTASVDWDLRPPGPVAKPACA